MEMAKTKGAVQEVTGGAKAAAGDMLGDTGMHLAGKAKELCGKSQQLTADAAETARDMVTDNPLMMLGVAAGVGMIIGALWAWRRD